MTPSMTTEDLQYQNLFMEMRSVIYPIRLKLSPTGIAYRNIKTGVNDHIVSKEISSTFWLHRAKGYCLRVQMTSGKSFRFDGFLDSDYDSVANFVKENFGLEVKKVDVSCKGWNHGSFKFTGDCLDFMVGDELGFEIPLHNVSKATTGKNELVLEFHQNDEADVSLTEIRFFTPTLDTGEDLAELAYEKIVKKADILQATGSSIVEFKDMRCLQPRGIYDIKVYASFFHMHGKTFDFKVPFTSLQRMFLLTQVDSRGIYFTLNFEPPLKHGKSLLQYIILNFTVDEDDITVNLNLTEEELAAYGEKLTSPMTGQQYEIVAQLFKVLSGRRITGDGSFESKVTPGAHAVSCSNKAQVGLLYPLERSLFFMPRPVINVRHEEINFIQFVRNASASMKTFDLELSLQGNVNYTFTNMDKEEYHAIFKYITAKNIVVKNAEGASSKMSKGGEDIWSSSESEDVDVYKERVKAEGRRKQAAQSGHAGDDDDDDDAEDEDFKPIPSSEESDVDEEYDSNASYKSSSESGSDASQKKAKKQKQKRETSDEESSGSEVSDKPAPVKRKGPRESGTQKKEKKQKRTKDPNAPKRPSTAFMFYSNENRTNIKAELPGSATITDVAKAVGERWNKLSAAEKEKYFNMQAEAKAKYEDEMKIYKEKLKRGEIPVVNAKAQSKPVKSKVNSSGPTNSNFKSQEYVESEESSESESLSD